MDDNDNQAIDLTSNALDMRVQIRTACVLWSDAILLVGGHHCHAHTLLRLQQHRIWLQIQLEHEYVGRATPPLSRFEKSA